MTQELHLDAETCRRLLAGELPPAEARRWAEHLERHCDVCEAFLARDDRDLDGHADAALGAAGAPGAGAGSDVEYARIQRALRGGRRRPLRVGAWAAVAAVALVAGGVALRVARSPREAEWTGVKGSAAAIPARLRFAIAGADPAAPERGASGQVVPSEAGLLFRIEVGAPAFVALVRAGGGEVETVFRQHAERPGSIDVTVEGRPAVYPLRGLSGTQRFILIAGAEPIGADTLREAARFLNGAAATRDPAGEDRLTVDVVEVTVR